MLYFRFNTDNFIAPQQTYSVTSYKDGKPVSEKYNETSLISLGDVESYFFKKLRIELGLDDIGIGLALYDVLGVPPDAFSVNDESIGSSDGVLKFVFSEYAKLPIKELDDRSLQDLGIKIEFCKRIANNESERLLNHYMQQNGFSYLTEDVLWKNLTNDEKVRMFSTYFAKISSEGKELIIVDPYFFKDESNEYCDMLASVINNANAQSIIVVTEQKNYKESSYNKISDKVSNAIEIKYSSDFHDRFWISDRKKGFYTGTSFNGIGKRISLINLLSENDVMEIIEELHQQSLI